MQKSTLAKPGNCTNNWYLIDAGGVVVGRLAAVASRMLQGKHKAVYTPFVDSGDHLIIINAEKAVFTGRKAESKVYRRHSLYPGGFKEHSEAKVRKEHPERILRLAIGKMMPRSKLGHNMLKKLHIYTGGEHHHQAQQPIAVKASDLMRKGA